MNDLVETLASVDVLERVRFTVAGETVEGVADSRIVAADRLVVLVDERDGRRRFRIQTRWASGWLDPLVDVLDPGSGERTFRPVGTLGAVGSGDRSGV